MPGRTSRILVFALGSVLVVGGASGDDLLVSSQDTNTIFRFDLADGHLLGTVLGPNSGLNGPVGMRIGPDGDLFIANQFGGNISRFDFATQQLTTFATVSDPTISFGPADIAFGPGGDLYASNFYGDSVLRFNGTTGAYVGQYTSGGTLSQPTFMMFRPDGHLLVSSLGTNEVLQYNYTDTSATFDKALITSGSAGLAFPAGLAIGPDSNLYVSSLLGQQVLLFDPTTGSPVNPEPFVNTPAFSFPSDLLFRPNGDLLISTTGSQGVLRYDGQSVTTFASAPGLQIGGQMLVVQSIPEASSLLLGGMGLAVLAATRMGRRRATIQD